MDWIPGLNFSILETDTFSLNLSFCFPPDEPPFALSPMCAVTYYDEDAQTKLNDHEAEELDSVFDKAFFNFLSHLESELGEPSRDGTYQLLDRTHHYCAWEQTAGLLILHQTPGDLHCGID